MAPTSPSVSDVISCLVHMKPSITSMNHHDKHIHHDYEFRISIYSMYNIDTMFASIHHINNYHMSPVMRKPAFCICENKDADQLRGNREADQRLCFRYTDSTIPLVPKYEVSSL